MITVLKIIKLYKSFNPYGWRKMQSIINKKILIINNGLAGGGIERASGSGTILYEKKLFKDEWIRLAFDSNVKLNRQCTAMDFVFDNGQPKLIGGDRLWFFT